MLPNHPPAPIVTPSAALTADQAREVLQEAARQQEGMERFLRLAKADEGTSEDS